MGSYQSIASGRQDDTLIEDSVILQGKKHTNEGVSGGDGK